MIKWINKPTMEWLTGRKAAIVNDLRFKTDAEDWHGVADCAMDLREVEARMDMLTPTVNECDHTWRYDIDTDGVICILCKERRVSMPV